MEKAQASFASEQALTEKLRQEIIEVQTDSQRKVSEILDIRRHSSAKTL